MIHAGTIRIGSGRTSAVVGAYWINSMRSLRKTTLPGVVARLRPTSKGCGPSGALPVRRMMSSARLRAPRIRFSPRSARVAAITSGLVSAKLDGAVQSEIMPATNAIRFSCSGVMP